MSLQDGLLLERLNRCQQQRADKELRFGIVGQKFRAEITARTNKERDAAPAGAAS